MKTLLLMALCLVNTLALAKNYNLNQKDNQIEQKTKALLNELRQARKKCSVLVPLIKEFNVRNDVVSQELDAAKIELSKAKLVLLGIETGLDVKNFEMSVKKGKLSAVIAALEADYQDRLEVLQAELDQAIIDHANAVVVRDDLMAKLEDITDAIQKYNQNPIKNPIPGMYCDAQYQYVQGNTVYCTSEGAIKRQSEIQVAYSNAKNLVNLLDAKIDELENMIKNLPYDADLLKQKQELEARIAVLEAEIKQLEKVRKPAANAVVKAQKEVTQLEQDLQAYADHRVPTFCNPPPIGI